MRYIEKLKLALDIIYQPSLNTSEDTEVINIKDQIIRELNSDPKTLEHYEAAIELFESDNPIDLSKVDRRTIDIFTNIKERMSTTNSREDFTASHTSSIETYDGAVTSASITAASYSEEHSASNNSKPQKHKNTANKHSKRVSWLSQVDDNKIIKHNKTSSSLDTEQQGINLLRDIIARDREVAQNIVDNPSATFSMNARIIRFEKQIRDQKSSEDPEENELHEELKHNLELARLNKEKLYSATEDILGQIKPTNTINTIAGTNRKERKL